MTMNGLREFYWKAENEEAENREKKKIMGKKSGGSSDSGSNYRIVVRSKCSGRRTAADCTGTDRTEHGDADGGSAEHGDTAGS